MWGDPIFYGLVSRGDVGIDLIHSHSIQGEPGDKGGAYIIVDDVDALHTELEGKGAGLWGLPEDREYGMRDFVAVDVNGYRLCFGQSVESASA